MQFTDISSASTIMDQAISISQNIKECQYFHISPEGSFSISSSQDIKSSKHPSKDDLQNILSASPQFSNSANEELKRTLQSKLQAENNYIGHLIKQFHATFNKVFATRLDESFNSKVRLSKEDEDLLTNIQKLVQLFSKVVKKIIIWIYEDLLIKAKKAWDEEYLKTSWVIDSIISEMLFYYPYSTFNKLVRTLLVKKCLNSMPKFDKILTAPYKLSDDSDFLRNYHLFSLEGNESPYEDVVKKISELQKSSCPYKNFQTIISLEQDILSSAKQHYGNDHQMNTKLAKKFEREVKVSILIYCIRKSKNISLLVDLEIAEAFVLKPYVKSQQSFRSFAETLKFLLNSEEMNRSIRNKYSYEEELAL